MNTATPLIDKSVNKTTHLATLDGLRELAALAVLWLHICELLQLNFPHPHIHMAVDFFFILSGYVVAKAYEAKLNGSMSFTHFVGVRLARLYPMIFITVLMGAFLLFVRMITTHTVTPYQIFIATISGLTLMPTSVLSALYGDELFPVNGALWSLLCELAINFVYAPLTRWLTNRKLVIIILLSSIAMCFIGVHFHTVGVGWGAKGFYCGFVRTIYSFAIGVLLYRFAPTGKTNGWMTILLFAVLMGALLAPVFPMNWVYEMLVLTLVFPPMVYYGATCINGPVLNQICLVLGALSYPVYLVHHSTMRITSNAFQMLHLSIPPYALAALIFVVSVITSAILLKLLDEPIRRRLTARRKKRDEMKLAKA